jgi:hypothetical protein
MSLRRSIRRDGTHPAFQGFLADIDDRGDEPPAAVGATVVGLHGWAQN